MQKKTVLIDLSTLSDLYHGFGQVALSYVKYFQKHYSKLDSEITLTFLMPKSMFGVFGDKVRYIDSTNWFIKHNKYLIPKHDVWHSITQLSRFKPAYTKTKLILTIHDLNYLYEASDKAKKKRHRRSIRKIKRADKIIFISEFTKNEVFNNFDMSGKSFDVIYNKVEWLEKERASKPVNTEKEPFFFSIGVLLRKKNFHVLLDMMKLMPEKHLYIAGNEAAKPELNGYAEMLKDRIKQENISNITLLGKVSHEEKIWLYQNCEAFLFPSLFEGFGMPVIEAMQFGKPVFSSQETSLKEIGSTHAYFWSDFNPENMKKTIEKDLKRFYDSPKLAENEIRYAKSFSTDKHFEVYVKLYQSI